MNMIAHTAGVVPSYFYIYDMRTPHIFKKEQTSENSSDQAKYLKRRCMNMNAHMASSSMVPSYYYIYDMRTPIF